MKSAKFWCLVILFFGFFLWLCTCLLGCEIMRHSKTDKQRLDQVNKSSSVLTDSGTGGNVKRQNNSSKEDYDWYKITQQFKPDTNITKIYNYPQPATIIYEGGKGTKEQTSTSIDSSWFKNQLSLLQSRYDSLTAISEAKLKDSKTETKGVGLITALLIGAGFLIVGKSLGFITSKYSIVKK